MLRCQCDRDERFGERPSVLVDIDLLQVADGSRNAAFFEERFEQIALRREMIVDSGVADARATSDVADAGAREALLGEEPQRNIQNLLSRQRSPARLARLLVPGRIPRLR